MNIAWLKAFVTVAACGSFTEGAEHLYTTQSVVSKHILALEKELNLTLFDRSKRQITLTPEGEYTLPHAKKIIRQYEIMADDIKKHKNASAKALMIASIPVMAQYNITALIAGFMARHPQIHLQIQELEASEIPASLEKHQYELAFCRRETVEGENKDKDKDKDEKQDKSKDKSIRECQTYDTIDIYCDQLVAILPKSHPLSSKKSLHLEQLQNESFSLLNKDTKLYDTCIKACNEAGFTPKIGYTGTRPENIVELVSNNIGVALLMERTFYTIKSDKVVIIPLAKPITSTIALIKPHNRKLSPAAKTFWHYIRNTV